MKKLIILAVTFVTAFILLVVRSNSASAMVLYEKPMDLNGKQFIVEFDEEINDFTIKFEYAENVCSNFEGANNGGAYQSFGKVEFYDENGFLLQTIDNIAWYQTNSYRLFYVTNHVYDGYQVHCMNIYGDTFIISNPEYAIWTIDDGMFYFPHGLDTVSWVGPSGSFNDLFSGFYKFSKHISEVGSYTYDKAYKEGYKQAFNVGYDKGVVEVQRSNNVYTVTEYTATNEFNHTRLILFSCVGLSVLLMSVMVSIRLFKKIKKNKRK